jgi:hypothetical protein
VLATSASTEAELGRTMVAATIVARMGSVNLMVSLHLMTAMRPWPGCLRSIIRSPEPHGTGAHLRSVRHEDSTD